MVISSLLLLYPQSAKLTYFYYDLLYILHLEIYWLTSYFYFFLEKEKLTLF